MSFSDTRQLGVIDRNESGVYSATVMKADVAGENFVISFVSGTTLIADYFLVYSLYRNFVDKQALPLGGVEAQGDSQPV